MKKLCFTLSILVSVYIVSAQNTPADTLQQYTGKYKFPDGSVVTEVALVLDNGVLKASSAMGSSDLRMTEGDIFEIVAYSGTATFKRNPEGKISGVQMVIGDINIEGSKTEGMIYNNRAYLQTAIHYRNPGDRLIKF